MTRLTPLATLACMPVIALSQDKIRGGQKVQGDRQRLFQDLVGNTSRPMFNIGVLSPMSYMEGRFYENVFAAITAKLDFESDDPLLPCKGCNQRFGVRLIFMDDLASQSGARLGALTLILGNAYAGRTPALGLNFEPVLGIMGGQLGGNCAGSAQIGHILQVPQVSWGCSTILGQATDSYPFFHRTRPMDFAAPLSALTRFFSWKRFTIVWEPANKFSHTATDRVMYQLENEINAHLVSLEWLADGSGHDFDNWWMRIEEGLHMMNNVWMPILANNTGSLFFSAMTGFIYPWMHWLLVYTLYQPVIKLFERGDRSLIGSFLIRPLSYHMLDDDWMAENFSARLQRYSRDKYKNSATSFGLGFDLLEYAIQTKGEAKVNRSLNGITDGSEWNSNSYWPYVYDAFYTFIYAIDSLFQQNKTAADIFGVDGGELLRKAVSNTSFTGVSKHMSFRQGIRPGDWSIDNFQAAGEHWTQPRVGAFTDRLMLQSERSFSNGSQKRDWGQTDQLIWKAGAVITLMDGSSWSPFSGDISVITLMPRDRLPQCPNGEVRNYSGHCNACKPGRFNNPTKWRHATDPDREACELCFGGKYADLEGATVCKNCPAGSDTNRNGGQINYHDKSGKSRDINEFEIIRCRSCDPGTYAEEGHRCLPCKVGKYQSKAGHSACEFARAGTYVNTTGASEATTCPLGLVAELPGLQACSPCKPGQFAKNTMMCSECLQGFFNPYAGSTACLKCEDVVGSSRTTAYLGATVSKDCVCPKDFYATADTGPCKKCETGMRCDFGSDIAHYWDELELHERTGHVLQTAEYAYCLVGSQEAQLQVDKGKGDQPWTSSNPFPCLEPGYFAFPRRPTDIYLCLSADFCPGSGRAGSLPCKTGFEDLNCGRCAPDFYKSGDECKNCQSTDTALAPAAFCVLMAMAGILHWAWNRKTAHVEAAESVLASVTCGTTIAFMQTLGIFGRLSLKWPADFKRVLDAMSFWVFDFKLLRVSCVFAESLTMSFFGSMLIPILIALVFASWYFLSRLLHVIFGERFKAFSGSSILNTIGLVTLALFISIASTTVSFFDCYESPNGEETLRMYSYVVCGSDDYYAALPFAIFGVLVYLVGLTSFMAIVLWIAPQKYHLRRFRTGVRFLVFKYRPSVWYWNLVIVVRSLLMAMVSIMEPNDAWIQLILIVIFLMGGLVLQLLYKPYFDQYANILEITELSFLILIIAIGSWFLTGASAEHPAKEKVMSVLLITSTVLCFLILFAVFCWALFLAVRPAKAHERLCHKIEQRLTKLRTSYDILMALPDGQLVSFLARSAYHDRQFLLDAAHIVTTQHCGYGGKSKSTQALLPMPTRLSTFSEGKLEIMAAISSVSRDHTNDTSFELKIKSKLLETENDAETAAENNFSMRGKRCLASPGHVKPLQNEAKSVPKSTQLGRPAF